MMLSPFSKDRTPCELFLHFSVNSCRTWTIIGQCHYCTTVIVFLVSWGFLLNSMIYHIGRFQEPSSVWFFYLSVKWLINMCLMVCWEFAIHWFYALVFKTKFQVLWFWYFRFRGRVKSNCSVFVCELTICITFLCFGIYRLTRVTLLLSGIILNLERNNAHAPESHGPRGELCLTFLFFLCKVQYAVPRMSSLYG